MLNAITIQGDFVKKMSEDDFFKFCHQNSEVRIERYNQTKIVVMPPTGMMVSSYDADVVYQLKRWNEEYKTGKVFGSSAGFTLPDKSVLSPDASWVSNERLAQLTIEDQRKFGHVCPEFLIEVKSESDRLSVAKEKMTRWVENGCQLAWLIDPEKENTHIYRADGTIEIIDGFDQKLSGETVLAGFELDLSTLRY